MELVNVVKANLNLRGCALTLLNIPLPLILAGLALATEPISILAPVNVRLNHAHVLSHPMDGQLATQWIEHTRSVGRLSKVVIMPLPAPVGSRTRAFVHDREWQDQPNRRAAIDTSASDKKKWKVSSGRRGRIKDLNQLKARLSAAGLTLGAPAFIRVFKAESELEVWLERHDRYVKFETYTICNYSGGLGPKLAEGDRQSPEGFYSIRRRDLRRRSRNHRALDINFPNAFDRALGRTGSHIQIHGGCNSTGCFAMKDAVIEEIYDVVAAALTDGQMRVPVHIFPFRMDEPAFAAYEASAFTPFWRSLQPFHDSFEQTGWLPDVQVCDREQLMAAGPAALDASDVACVRTWTQPVKVMKRRVRGARKSVSRLKRKK